MEVRPGYKQTEMGVIPQDWELTPLAHLCAFITKGSTPTTYGFKWEQSGVLFLRSECVSEHGFDLTQSMFISPAAHVALRRSEVEDGDILVTITGNVGRVVRLAGVGKANLNQHIARVRVTAPYADAGYISHFLSQPASRRRFSAITTGQAYPQISLRQVRDAEIPLPPLSEQRAIAAALSDVDALLAKLDALIAKKRDLKQAAMQQLLTGRTRLPGFSGEWEVKPVGEVFGVTAGGDVDPLRSKGYRDEIYRYPIYSNAITGLGLYGFCSYADHQAGSITITARGTLGVANFRDHAYTAIGRVLVLEPKDEVDSRFFAAIINNRIEFAVESTGVPQLTAPQISTYKLPAPPLPEQTAIATALSDMDAEIAGLEASRDKTHALKHGMMQELLTGRIRLV
jgi:type I restriction enzyme S subunit